jgi:hypothetical protein
MAGSSVEFAPSPATAQRELPAASPSLRSVVTRVAATLWVSCIAPALLFAIALAASGLSAAIVVALVWLCGVVCWRWATSGPPCGLLILTIAIMTVRSAIALATGNAFVYFIQPVFADVAVSALFLGSLLTTRPLVARLAPDFYPMTDALAARPRVHALFRRLTLMWGLVVLSKGIVTLWLLESQSTVNFVIIKNSAVIAGTVLAAGATIRLSVTVARREGVLAAA